MGSLFSKDKKQKNEERKGIGSAPSRLEGLDGTTPPDVPEVPKRALTPDTASRQKSVSPVAVSAAADSPSPASTTSPTEEKKLPLVAREESSRAPGLAPGARGVSQAEPEEAPDDALEPSSEAEASAPPLAATECQTPTKRAPKKIDYVGAQSDGTKLAADLPAAVQVPEEASGWTAVLGESTVRSLHSPDWKTREQALQAVMRNLGNARFNAEHGAEDIWITVTQLLDKALKDKVAPLYYSALELLSTLVSSYSTQLPFSVLSQGLEPLMPTLLHRVGNNNARIQPSLGLAFLAPHALSAIPKKSQMGAAAASQMAGRLELITCMLNVQVQQQMGFGTAGRTAGAGGRGVPDALPAEEIVCFTRPALDMPDDKVRAAAVRLVAEVYRGRKAAGQAFEVEKMLGGGVKPALLQVLHRRFTEVDEEIAGGGARAAGNEDVPVGPGITIKAPGSGGRAATLPPLNGRFGALPALAVKGSRPGAGALGGPPFSAGNAGTGGLAASSSDPLGRPPRTPLSPGSAGGSRGGRTPPRTGGPRAPSPMRGGSPMRASRGDPMAPGALLPGSLPDSDGADVLMIQSGTSTPVRGNSSQSVRNTSSQSNRGHNSLKPRSRESCTGRGNQLDDAEEQLIEYILNDEARAAA
ncbi:hypothetical protein VOLCADRAFT_105644 [Volvox carteri f. nagariensis]|uniref:TOG domain-containing protein n=1 Tax=Volvox carteri f. nagariensis TaxID=3068 RepID=D8U221_VOLCA|nr:uncharacterized protein VOLCADRAFT_105644 [Volvox carteri f. nagariensis]EFJ46205.1 hypothetical protein VOLCADRAFT_105644 [Volvox carteri f. nagariensis]|eukprot:XP_002952652.1 hypothetical protein VOLCADRAFT_105644 [Volvox carteri f. nagariensis]